MELILIKLSFHHYYHYSSQFKIAFNRLVNSIFNPSNLESTLGYNLTSLRRVVIVAVFVNYSYAGTISVGAREEFGRVSVDRHNQNIFHGVPLNYSTWNGGWHLARGTFSY